MEASCNSTTEHSLLCCHLEKIKESLPKHHVLDKTEFRDIRTYYQSLKKYDKPITYEELQKYNCLLTKDSCNLHIIWFINNNIYDVCFTQKEINKDVFTSVFNCFNSADAVANIKIYGATYAQYQPEGEICEWLQPINLVKKDDYFTLPDITYENPLFPGVWGAQQIIKTDGTKVIFDEIWFDTPHHSAIVRFNHHYGVSWFPSVNKVSLCGHIIKQSMCFDISKLQ